MCELLGPAAATELLPVHHWSIDGVKGRKPKISFCSSSSDPNELTVDHWGIDGITGKKSKISFCSSSNNPNESAIEFDSVQFGNSTVPGRPCTGVRRGTARSFVGLLVESLSVCAIVDPVVIGP